MATTVATVPTVVVPRPMLASSLAEIKVQEVTAEMFAEMFPAHLYALEPKLDGHRKLLRKHDGEISWWSRGRQNGPCSSWDAPEALTTAAACLPDGIYDGEYMAVGEASRSWDAATDALQKQFVIFDVLECRGISTLNYTYDSRRAVLNLVLEFIRRGDATGTMAVVNQLPVALETVHKIWAAGGEGGMLKLRTGTYRPGARVPDWIKLKGVETHVCTITGFAKGSYGPHSIIRLTLADGTPTTVKTKNNAWLAAFAMGADRYIGRQVTIECQLRTPSGSPRHPMIKRFVDAELDHLVGEETV